MKIIYENEELGPSQGREKPTTTYKNIKIGAFEDGYGESMSISGRGWGSIVGTIARIAKAASQKLPGKSSLNGSFVLSCPALSSFLEMTYCGMMDA